MILIDCGNSTLKAQYRPANRVQASFGCAYRGPWVRDFERWLGRQPASEYWFRAAFTSEEAATARATRAGLRRSGR